MVNTIFNAFSEQAKNVYEPAIKFNQLMLSNAEKIARAQITAFNSYAELGFSQLQEAATIKDVAEMKDFVNKQAEFAGSVSKLISEDANRMMNLGHAFKDDIAQFTEEVTKEFGVEPVKAAAATAKKASK